MTTIPINDLIDFLDGKLSKKRRQEVAFLIITTPYYIDIFTGLMNIKRELKGQDVEEFLKRKTEELKPRIFSKHRDRIDAK